MGWYYTQLNMYAEKHQPSWVNAAHVLAYKAAVGVGMSDFLEDYVHAVSSVEECVLTEGPMPLNAVHQRLQKYLIVMPTLFAIICDVDATFVVVKNKSKDPLGLPPTAPTELHGAIILDYLMNYQSGMPVIKSVVDRLTVHVQQVFLKQCLGWMLFGELLDCEEGNLDSMGPSDSQFRAHERQGAGGAARKGSTGAEIGSSRREFFVQPQPQTVHRAGRQVGDSGSFRSTEDSLLQQVSSQLTAAQMNSKALFAAHSMGNGSASGAGAGPGGFGSQPSAQHQQSQPRLPFDWNSSYSLKYELIPQSMVSLSLASLVLFSGKAVKLMAHMNSVGGSYVQKSGTSGLSLGLSLGAGAGSSKREEVHRYFISHGAGDLRLGTTGGGGQANQQHGILQQQSTNLLLVLHAPVESNPHNTIIINY